MEQYGHVKISRKAYECDPFWTERRVFSKWEAWEDCIQMAAWGPYRKMVGLSAIELKRGEFLASVRYLAKRWCWSEKRVRNFCETLQLMGRIRAQVRTREGHVYLLVNYEVYQTRGTGKGTDEGTDGAQQGHKEEANKQLSKKKRESARPKNGIQIPTDWKPNGNHAALAKKRNVDLQREADTFEAHAMATGRTLKNWDAGFTMWLMKAFPQSNKAPAGSEAARFQNGGERRHYQGHADGAAGRDGQQYVSEAERVRQWQLENKDEAQRMLDEINASITDKSDAGVRLVLHTLHQRIVREKLMRVVA